MPRDEQGYLPGTEPVKNAKVHRRAREYQTKRDARIAANREEAEAHEQLLEVMIAEGLDFYEYGNLKVVVNNKKKCKVEDATKTKEETNGEE